MFCLLHYGQINLLHYSMLLPNCAGSHSMRLFIAKHVGNNLTKTPVWVSYSLTLLRPTQPVIRPGSINRVPSSAEATAELISSERINCSAVCTRFIAVRSHSRFFNSMNGKRYGAIVESERGYKMTGHV